MGSTLAGDLALLGTASSSSSWSPLESEVCNLFGNRVQAEQIVRPFVSSLQCLSNSEGVFTVLLPACPGLASAAEAENGTSWLPPPEQEQPPAMSSAKGAHRDRGMPLWTKT